MHILPQWQDPGDAEYIWIAVEDESDGRVTITPVNYALRFKPQYVVRTDMLEKGAGRVCQGAAREEAALRSNRR